MFMHIHTHKQRALCTNVSLVPASDFFFCLCSHIAGEHGICCYRCDRALYMSPHMLLYMRYAALSVAACSCICCCICVCMRVLMLLYVSSYEYVSSERSSSYEDIQRWSSYEDMRMFLLALELFALRSVRAHRTHSLSLSHTH
jgi:hypothetical protein